MNAINPYLKFIVAVLGATVTSVTVAFPHASWIPILTSVVTALTVYLTPNLPRNAATVNVNTQPMPAPVKDSASNPFGSA